MVGDPVRDVVWRLADSSVELGRRLARASRPVDVLVAVALERVAGAAGVTVAVHRQDRYVTIAATDDRARAADELQFELDAGPSLDAIRQGAVREVRDLAGDRRWPALGRRAVGECGVAGALSYPLPGEEASGALTVYTATPDAFDAEARDTGLVLAQHGVLALRDEECRARIANLERALESSRAIGVAVGVLMVTAGLSEDGAFGVLRARSQHQNRKLREVAEDVVRTHGVTDDL